MKLAHAKNDQFENHLGNVQTAQFSIAANGKAFKGLIDGLYSDKAQSITRELWSNALDAHIAAGNPETPFYVEVPSRMSPVFLVRDYGTGMDHETVMSVYTTMFASTKDGSNDMVGAFGLGSKTPFAYVDTFSLNAFDGTERRSYMAFLDGSGVPNLSLMLTEPSDEPRGIEVTFPVQPHDVSAFVTAASKVIQGFDVPPTGVNVPEQDETEWMLTGVGWKFSKDRWSKDMVRQGCAIYPTERLHGLAGKFAIDVPIGSVEVTLSRESLSMTPTTTAVVQSAYARAEAEARQQVADLIAAATDDYERAMLALTYRDTSLTTTNQTLVRLGTPADAWPLRSLKGDEVSSRDVSVLKQVTIYVDRGEKIPRRRLRIRQLNFRANTTATFMFDATVPSADIALTEIIKIWHLELDQIKSLAVDMPDVPHTPRAKQPPKPIVIPPNAGWATYTEGSRSIVDVSGKYWRIVDAQAVLETILGAGFKVIPYTVRQSAKLNPKDSVDFKLGQVLKSATDKALTEAIRFKFLTGYPGIDSKMGKSTDASYIIQAARHFDKPRYDTLEEAVSKKVNDLTSTYPMLSFYTATPQDKNEYIAAMDVYREAKANGRI